jgi:hypothetical protein
MQCPGDRLQSRFVGRTNLSLAELRRALENSGTGEAYAYVIRTVAVSAGELKQKGCGPNWDGGLITLCTCKAQMRSRRAVPEWPGLWIAGFTGCTKTPRGNVLVFLMRVDRAFESYYDLWNWLPDNIRQAKAAHQNPRGDLFEPIKNLHTNPAGRFNPRNYKPPHKDHPHSRENPKNKNTPRWYRDVDYASRHGKRAPYLVGDPKQSCVWTRAGIYLKDDKLPRDYRKYESMIELLERLTE